MPLGGGSEGETSFSSLVPPPPLLKVVLAVCSLLPVIGSTTGSLPLCGMIRDSEWKPGRERHKRTPSFLVFVPVTYDNDRILLGLISSRQVCQALTS